MSTTTRLTELKINYLTQAQYDVALENDEISENEIYMTPTENLIDIFYPVGSYYETSDTTFNPNTTWGGTWILETEGQVHVSAGTNYSVSGATGASGAGISDGGDTDAIVPYHNHGFTNPTINRDTNVALTNNHSVSITQPVFKILKDALTTESTSTAHTHTAIGYRTNGASGTATRTPFGYNNSSLAGTLNSAGMSANETHTHKVPNADYTTSRTTDVGVTVSAHGITQPVFSASNGAVLHEGVSVTDANMQPYIVVNRWHRTA